MKWCLHRNICTAKYFFVENWAFSCYMALLEGPKTKRSHSRSQGVHSELYDSLLYLQRVSCAASPCHERRSGCETETQMSPTVWTKFWSSNSRAVFPRKSDFNVPDPKLMRSGRITLTALGWHYLSHFCKGRHALHFALFRCILSTLRFASGGVRIWALV